MKIKQIAIIGASGKTGSRVLKYLLNNLKDKSLNLKFFIVSNESKYLNKDIGDLFGCEKYNKNFSSNINDAIESSDIIIDFSTKKITEQIINLCANSNSIYDKKFIIGTTPFEKINNPALEECLKKNLVFYSENMSIIINLLGNFLKKFSTFFNENYDLSIQEIHHIHKKDSPSGTAKMLRDKLAFQKNSEKIQVTSLRMGDIYGIHNISLINQNEIFEVKHHALNRDLFADGVFKILNWMKDLNQNGLIEMNDFTNDFI